ncbi:nucleotidyltransferase family protein [uncultured Methanobrevibacter sp.]|uniref:nucleotidyltransferase family protein n=1 Tax=uncultured Methanobrevibacter sp. TaxID=253161 RepID=UPI0025DFB907|nr:nucleotidyltransferase domain-containing protein [uncultured Methanobrevibacter sp.]
MIFTIEEITKRTTPIAIKHGVNRLCLFGSYARNEAREGSDLDFIMDDGDVTSLIKYMSFVQDLEDEFNCHVDLVSACSYNKNFLNKIKKDVVIIYER